MNVAACAASGVPGMVGDDLLEQLERLGHVALAEVDLGHAERGRRRCRGAAASTRWNCASASATLPCAK